MPWFFFVSGVFLRNSMMKYDGRTLVIKKLKSLVVPFALWTLLSFPLGGNPDLWYLQSLIIFTFVMWGLGRLGLSPDKPVFSIVFCLIFCLLLFLNLGWTYGTPTSPFYFVGGFVCSRIVLKEQSRPKWQMAILVLVCAIACRIMWFNLSLSGVAEMILRNVCVVVLGCSIWLLIGLCPVRTVAKYDCLRVTFFVYCFHHHFVLDWVKTLWQNAIGIGPVKNVVGLFIVAAIAMASSCVVALALKKHLSRCYALLSGGR